MSSEPIPLQVPPKLFGVSGLLVRQQKMHGSQKCCGELAELTVDDIWQIADAGDQELGRMAHTANTL